MHIIGQEKLKEHFGNLLHEERFPKLCILVGEFGQGKYTFAKQTAEYIGDIYEPNSLKVDDIRAMVEDSQALSRKRAYILRNADEMTVQAQNAILKFAEEPTSNSYIMLTIEHEDNVLPTIKSRGSLYHLEPYTKKQLQHFTEDLQLLDMYSNPGQIKRAQQVDIKKLEAVTDKVINNIHIVSAANVFNILKHFEGFDYDLIISTILYKLLEEMKKAKEEISQAKILNQVRVIYKYKNQLKNKSINKDNAMEMMFVELREKAL